MTIEVTPMWSRNATNTESQDGVKFTANLISGYQITHAPSDTRSNILSSANVPNEGDVFSDNGVPLPGVYCVSRDLNQVSPIYSVLIATWKGEYGPNGITDDPLNAEPVIQRGNSLVSAEVDSDFYGQPITNSIGEPVKGITTDISDFQISIKRNYAAINMYAIRQYLRSHNSDYFDGWPPGTARFRTYTADEKKFQGRSYHEVNAVIQFREPYNTTEDQAWFARYRNEGFYERAGVVVTFSGGGGSGAHGYAVTNSSGGISKVIVTNRGSGYTTAPSVAFTKKPSSSPGSGAIATASINSNGVVTGVSVGTAGSAYRSTLLRAVDDVGEPMTTPVLLAADGTRLENADEAVWCTRPLSGPLPYANLGLL